MKTKIIAAALAAFFMFPIFGLTALAAPEDMTETPFVAESVTEPEATPDAETEDAPEIDIDVDMDDMAAWLSLFALMGAMDNGAKTPNSALPPGTATVIDYNTDPDGRLFYTIMTPDEHYFYLVIDKESTTNNVYFLNAVTISDLIPLAQNPLPQQGGTVTNPPPNTTGNPEPSTETPPPAEQPQGGGNMGMYIIVGILVIAGGGAGWYFKIYRPKQERIASGDEYDPSMNEAENDYPDDWDENPDEGDDSPPWDEDGDGESGDGEDE